MKKMIYVTNHKCEKCDTSVGSRDKFCSNCGNDLMVELVYEEDIKEREKRNDILCSNTGYRP